MLVLLRSTWQLLTAKTVSQRLGMWEFESASYGCEIEESIACRVSYTGEASARVIDAGRAKARGWFLPFVHVLHARLCFSFSSMSQAGHRDIEGGSDPCMRYLLPLRTYLTNIYSRWRWQPPSVGARVDVKSAVARTNWTIQLR